MTDPVIIEAALNGVTNPQRNARVPATPDALAHDALECIDAGATVIHTHAPNIAVPPEEAAEQYAATYRAVLDRHPNAICYPTTGIGPTIEQRYEHIAMLAAQGLIRAGFVDTGSVNLGGTGSDGLPTDFTYVYTNTFADVAHKMRVCREQRLGPSVAIFEPGFLRVVLAYQRAGALPAGTLVKFYFSGGGYLGGGDPLWGAPPIAEALDLYLAMLGDAPIPWAVAVLGGSLLDTPVARLALERGGHLRVGLEDWDDGPSNLEQVDAAVKLCHDVGRDVASTDQTAALLQLPQR
ncbi:MAG TPA: 3-keto-5-aminohexanoate cleavage protein [Acidimicrobiia bacterium]|nr:3-keto-5-aminohexanoate cleavage protein [Acidimicrobiia bacterium]